MTAISGVCMTAKLYHADLWGTRDRKYDWLLDHDLNTTEWQEIHPKSEFYFFVPRDERHLAQYETFRKIRTFTQVLNSSAERNLKLFKDKLIGTEVRKMINQI